MDWRFNEQLGTADQLHNMAAPLGGGFTAALNQIATDALVLGSSQTTDLIDQKRANDDSIEIAKRRTGGGIVFIDKRQDAWLDIYVPSDAPFLSPKIENSFDWLGLIWLEALKATAPEVGFRLLKSKPTNPASLAGSLCFNSMGFGEIALGPSKVVGISQRRSRDYSKFQCLYCPSGGLTRVSKYLTSKPSLISAQHDVDLLPSASAVVEVFMDQLHRF